MPFPNYHTSRQQDPGKYESIRTSKNKFGEGIDVLFGVKKGGSVEVQSIHFLASKFTVAEARKWLREHNYKTNIVPATGGKAITPLQKATKNITKGLTRLCNIIPNPELEKLVDEILETSKDFTYPDYPNPLYSKPYWVLSPIDGNLYNPGKGPDFISLSISKNLKKVRKSVKNISKGFTMLKETNGELYNFLELSIPLDLVTDYARALESALMERTGI